jgi:hypothetical protein
MVMIDQTVMNWQWFFEIQDGSGRHLGFCENAIIDDFVVFCVQVITFPSIFEKISPRV